LRSMTSRSISLASSNLLPFMKWHISLAALGEILRSLPLAIAVLSGSSPWIEYFQDGMYAPYADIEHQSL